MASFWKKITRFFSRSGGDDRRRDLSFFQTRSVTDLIDTSNDPEWTYTFSEVDDGEEAISASVWVYACAREIAAAIGSVRVEVLIDGEPAPDDHPLVKLLKEPVPNWTLTRWLQTAANNLTLGGATYVEKVRAQAIGRSAIYPGQGLPKEIWPHPASYFEPDVDETARRQVVTGYSPRVGNTNEVLPSEIIHIMQVRPGDVTRGLGSVEPAAGEINTDRQASGWQQTAFGNRGVPDGVFSYNGELPLTLTEEEEVEAQIDARWSGIVNAHKPFVLGRDLQWQDLGKTLVELELMEGRRFTKSAICAAFGVPTVLFDVAESTFSNLETALFAFWSGTVLLLADLIVDGLNVGLAPEYGPGVTIRVDKKGVDALLPLHREKWLLAKHAFEMGVPMVQIVDMLSLPVEQYDGIETGWVSAGLQPSDTYSVAGGASG